jgi:XTP/dITP diphosphohydrolase
MRFLAATNNSHKIIEFRGILGPLGIEFISPSDIGGIPEVDETGSTFEENAGLKALEAAKFADMQAFADDSGLEIEALDNAPGIYSARYADDNNGRITRVLRELKEVEERTGKVNRNARFVCVIAFASPENVFATFRGEVYGKIIDAPRGEGGFGYDPVFMPDGYDKTFAELAAETKDEISHRANALNKAKEFFRQRLSG